MPKSRASVPKTSRLGSVLIAAEAAWFTIRAKAILMRRGVVGRVVALDYHVNLKRKRIDESARMTVQCPKCSVRGQSGERWHATGRRNTNRYGRRRAELVCDVCGYAFSSGLPAAMEAAEAVTGSVEPAGETAAAAGAELTATLTNVTQRRPLAFKAVEDLVKDWKLKQAGDE